MTAICPKCEYARKPTDKVLEGECPSCGVIYEKFLEAGLILASAFLDDK